MFNRANARRTIFTDPKDYEAFETVLAEAVLRSQTRLLTYCVMPNHWHLVVWPHEDGELSEFVGWLTLTHTQRWHAHRQDVGSGHLYQGRFKSFLIQQDLHLQTVIRYVEANPLRANLVRSAERWRWSGLWRRTFGDEKARDLLSEWPTDCPDGWLALVNAQAPDPELRTLRDCTTREQPFGSESWVRRTTDHFGLQSAWRPPGRPPKP